MLTDEQVVELKAELDDDPLGRGYGSMNNDQARIDMNTEYREYSFDMPIDEFAQRIRDAEKADDFIYRSEAMMLDPTYNPDSANPAEPWATRRRFPYMHEFTTGFQGRIAAIDSRAHPNRIAKEGATEYWPRLLDRCETEGSMGAGLVAAAKALCETTVSRAWELFDQPVTTADVERARALP